MQMDTKRHRVMQARKERDTNMDTEWYRETQTLAQKDSGMNTETQTPWIQRHK